MRFPWARKAYARLLLSAHAQRVEIKQLLDAGVSPVSVEALYPFQAEDFGEAFLDLAATEQGAKALLSIPSVPLYTCWATLSGFPALAAIDIPATPMVADVDALLAEVPKSEPRYTEYLAAALDLLLLPTATYMLAKVDLDELLPLPEAYQLLGDLPKIQHMIYETLSLLDTHWRTQPPL